MGVFGTTTIQKGAMCSISISTSCNRQTLEHSIQGSLDGRRCIFSDFFGILDWSCRWQLQWNELTSRISRLRVPAQRSPESFSTCTYANRRRLSYGSWVVPFSYTPVASLYSTRYDVPGTSTSWSLCKLLVYNLRQLIMGCTLTLLSNIDEIHEERMYEALKCTNSPTGRHGVSWWWWFCMWLLNLLPQLVHKTGMQVQTSVSSTKQSIACAPCSL